MTAMPNSDPTLGELLGGLAQKTGVLVRQEIQLARTEMTAQAALGVRELGKVVLGGALGHAGLLAVVTAIVIALGAAIPMWLSALIIGVMLLGAAYALVQWGVRSLRQMDPLPRTKETLREDKALLQEQMR